MVLRVLMLEVKIKLHILLLRWTLLTLDFRHYIQHYIHTKSEIGRQKRAPRNKRLGFLEPLGPKEWETARAGVIFWLFRFCATLKSFFPSKSGAGLLTGRGFFFSFIIHLFLGYEYCILPRFFACWLSAQEWKNLGCLLELVHQYGVQKKSPRLSIYLLAVMFVTAHLGNFFIEQSTWKLSL